MNFLSTPVTKETETGHPIKVWHFLLMALFAFVVLSGIFGSA